MCTAVVLRSYLVKHGPSRLYDTGTRGGAYSFVACLSHLIIYHASLSRRSTVPTPNRDTPNVWALITLFPYTVHQNCLLILSPSCFAACCHHLSPRIAIFFSLLSGLPNSFMSHSSNFLISSSSTSRSSLYISHSPTVCVLLYCCATRAHMRIHVFFLPTIPGEGVVIFMHGRSLLDHRLHIPTMPRRGTSAFRRPSTKYLR